VTGSNVLQASQAAALIDAIGQSTAICALSYAVSSKFQVNRLQNGLAHAGDGLYAYARGLCVSEGTPMLRKGKLATLASIARALDQLALA
jgi:hypothetical protein